MKFNFKKTFSTPFFNLEEGFDNNQPNSIPYYRLTGLDSVICCVMTMLGDFVMVKQYRPSIEEQSLEFPAGSLLIDENPLDGANREFSEETSYRSDFLYLGNFRLMINRTNIKEHLFFGLNPKKITQSIPERGIEVQLINREKLSKLSTSGSYKQLAGLGIIQLSSNYLGVDIIKEPMDVIYKKFKTRYNSAS
jgi:ADP-ribose pyrophosphatase YjhB (NUDIX family)